MAIFSCCLPSHLYAARDQALAALDGAPSAPLLSIHTFRQYSYASRAGVQVAELSLDERTIMAGGRRLGFRELEIELLADRTRADLNALNDQLQARFRLIPESRGKKKRGIALLEGAGRGSPTAALAREPEDALAVGAPR